MKKWVVHLIKLSVILFVGVLPIILGFAGHEIGAAINCPVSFSGAHPCVIGERDYGQLLHNIGTMYAAAIVSVPLAGIIIVIYLIILLVQYFIHQKKSSKSVL